MDVCPACGAQYKSASSKFCSECGAPRPVPQHNVCTNPECKNHACDLGPKERYCDLCGSLTTYGQKIAKALGH